MTAVKILVTGGALYGEVPRGQPKEDSPKRPGEIFRSAAAIGLARRTLDWRPGVPLHEGLRKTIAWHLYARQAPQIC